MACRDARARLAAAPEDEDAIEALFDAVSRAGREIPPRAPQNIEQLAPEVAEAARLVVAGAEEAAESLLRRHLSVARNDPDAMLMMADIAHRCGFPENSEKILRRSVEIHPSRSANWVALARALTDRAKKSDEVALAEEALACLDRALASDPEHEEALSYKAALLVQLRRLEDGRAQYERFLDSYPEDSRSWINLAYVLKTLGHFGEAVAAFRTGIALDPLNGAAWYMLADLKLARFSARDIGRMEEALGQDLSDDCKTDFHFALAAAYDRAKKYDSAAAHLQQGSALRLKAYPHDIEEMQRSVGDAMRTYTSDFFARRTGSGAADSSPIFVLGMPRSGSTLVEQILSSHSAVEGTAELFAVQQLESELCRDDPARSFAETVDGLDIAEFRRLGQRYIELTTFHRRTDRARFIDKNPGNWQQVGFIHTMLPNAGIIDIRRHPLDCCFANYTQHFVMGVNYSYGLKEVASQYREYVRFMRHIDAVMPGRVHRIIYEDLVEDTPAEVRRTLDYLGLKFEETCLRFFETTRAIHTPSSEQVRQPINRSGIGKWKSYEPWIGLLKSELGDLLEDWRR